MRIKRSVNALKKRRAILKQAKGYADGVVKTEKERAEEQEGLLPGRLETLEGIIGGNAEGALGDVIADVAENAAATITEVKILPRSKVWNPITKKTKVVIK